jgi:hypothetical protein
LLSSFLFIPVHGGLDGASSYTALPHRCQRQCRSSRRAPACSGTALSDLDDIGQAVGGIVPGGTPAVPVNGGAQVRRLRIRPDQAKKFRISKKAWLSADDAIFADWIFYTDAAATTVDLRQTADKPHFSSKYTLATPGSSRSSAVS